MKGKRMKKFALALTLACLLGPASTRAQNAYITNENSNTVSVIDTATDTVSATIPVGLIPFGVAVSPDGSKVYVTNSSTANSAPNTVQVIDTATNTVSATITVGLTPVCNPPVPCTMAVAVSPDGSKVYVTNEFANTVSVIDAATNMVSATIPVPSFLPSHPFGVAVSPDGNMVYVANNGTDTVSVIDTATNTISATIHVGRGP